MANVLVFVEQHGGAFLPSSLGVLTRAREIASQLGGEAVALVAGNGVADLAATLGAYGVSRVLVADDARLEHPIPGPVVDALEAAVRQESPAVVFASAGVLAAEVAGGLAGRLGIGINTDGTDVRVEGDAVVFTRPALDDSVLVDCGFRGGEGTRGIALFRANTFAAAAANGGHATVEQLEVPASGAPGAEFLGYDEQAAGDGGGVDITQADVLVGAGRGLGGPENFGIVESLAKAVGGEVATTRAVVDAGWYDYSTQVGQTGKTVAPKVYIAVGISGAIQHKIGMQNSGTIIAINKDPHAPIFEFADFGVVGDLFQIVPKLEEAIREKKGG